MKACLRALMALAVLVCAPVCNATLISYTATNVANSTWRYDYAITNDSLPSSLTYFVLEFDRDLYTNLRDQAAPVGWDVVVLQPDPELPDDGIFDALALDEGIAFGATLAGFSLTFDFLGSGIPLQQPFTVLDPFTFEVVDIGVASGQPQVSVPEPGTLAMFALALLLLPVATRRMKSA